MNAPTSLAEIGMKEEDLDLASEYVTKYPYFNPRPIDKIAIRQLLGLDTQVNARLEKNLRLGPIYKICMNKESLTDIE